MQLNLIVVEFQLKFKKYSLYELHTWGVLDYVIKKRVYKPMSTS